MVLINQKIYLNLPLIKIINNHYHSKVLKIYNKKKKKWESMLMYKGIDIFLKNTNKEYKKKFLNKIDKRILSEKKDALEYSRKTLMDKKNINKNMIRNSKKKYKYGLFEDFIKNLLKINNLKIFIGKDAYSFYDCYKNSTKKKDSLFIKYSRTTLFKKSNGIGYCKLVNIIYSKLNQENRFKEFWDKYKTNLKKDKKFYLKIKIKTMNIFRKHIKTLNKFNKITIIDSGVQGSLLLLLKAILEDEGYNVDYRLFTCYNWISFLFRKKVKTNNLFIFHILEYESARKYLRKEYLKR